MEIRRRDHVVIVAPQKDLDGQHETAELARQVDEALARGDKALVVDLSGVKYANSSGLGTLVAAHLKAREMGGVLYLTGVSKRIYNILEITRLAGVFKVAETEDEACAALQP
ncbi:MAG: STAS domain-containing protein [Candidatus Eisenbacteria bacterium]|nr:STAS domain-containing protein [Candidatus Eisenbacteria bacterium]